jgi:phosphonate transport system substrate-binding protein
MDQMPKAPKATRTRKLFFLALAVIITAALPAGRAACAESGTSDTLVVGFTAAHFSDINRSDAVAAMRVWIETVIETRGLGIGAEAVIYNDVESLMAALQSGTPDLMILLTPEFFSLELREYLDPRYVSVRGPGVGEYYLLVVQKDVALKSASDLEGRTLIIKEGARMSLAEEWFQRFLTDSGLPGPGNLFENVKHEVSLSRTILPVFFGKADACLVTRNGFEMMCELNPQLRQRLVPLATSPRLVPSVTCLRNGFDTSIRDEVVDALGALHEDPKGQQILSIFGVDRLVPFEPQYLTPVCDLLEKSPADH